ncbi:MAG TPA: TrkA C-terminal domain-containing protein, partial [Tepidisphaeraceae bacterium]
AAVVLGKVITCSLGTFLAGHDARTSVKTGMGLAQIGEFSFIIASLGLTLKVTSDFLYPVAVAVSALTTLLTPYLIKFSDPLVTAGAKVVPPGLVATGNYYQRWVNGAGSLSRDSALVRSLLRKWLAQILLNMMLVTGMFLIAAGAARKLTGWGEELPAWTGGPRTALWLGAMILSMPLLIVSFRKLRAVSLVLAEAAIPKSAGKDSTDVLRGMFGGTIRVLGLVVLLVWVAALSIAVMPPSWPVLAVLLAGVVLIAFTQRQSFERVYGRAQIALRDTFATPSAEHELAAEAKPMPTVLQRAELGEVLIAPNTPASGRLIRELALRSKTGASAVGIERDGSSVLNPGPDEELLPGDRLVLLGSREQVEAARRLLMGEMPLDVPQLP